jgi:HPt (histidine-containing phosphotransfer) domain-containing protein
MADNELAQIWSRDVTTSNMSPALFDRQAVLDRMLGDLELLVEVVEIFRATYPARMDEIRTAIAQKDPGLLERSAHALKSSIGNFSAFRAMEAAHKLELLGREGKLQSAGEAFGLLEQEMESLQAALDLMLGSLNEQK